MSSSSPGRVIVISGPSGAGKSTLLKQLLARCDRLVTSVSATTRPPRPGEVDGRDYHFISRQEFERRLALGDFLEHAELFGAGDLYGTLVDEVAPRLAEGKWVVLEIDVEGTRAIVQQYPDAVTIFVRPASLEELERRLRSRGTETADAIARRMHVARQEMSQAGQYRYQVTNQTVEQAVEEILQILGHTENCKHA